MGVILGVYWDNGKGNGCPLPRNSLACIEPSPGAILRSCPSITLYEP